MASVRCPGCGAKNSDGAIKCRICSYDLRESMERPLTQPKAGTAVMRSGKLSGVLGLAALGVVAIVLAGVLLGLLPGGDVITDVRNKIPFLKAQTDDGWSEFTEPSASFRATMPVDRAQREIPFAASPTGTLQSWVSTLGDETDPDTLLSVGWTTVDAPVGEQVEASLNSTAVAWASSLGGKLDKYEEVTVQGQPALAVRIDGLSTPNGDDMTINVVLIRQRQTLFVISSTSIYPDHPQFDRLVNGFALL